MKSNIEKILNKKTKEALMSMPPLSHNPFPDRPFSWKNSLVIAWIKENISNDFNDSINIFGSFKKQCLSFDRKTKLWKGIKHDNN